MITRVESSIHDRRRQAVCDGQPGFTLLELVIAVTMLAVFVLPMLQLITEARVRAIRYTNQRQVRDLAQQKLHDRIHYYEEENEGNFAAEGRPDWQWIIDEPQIQSKGEQVILEYTIRVTVPQKLDDSAAPRGEGTTYEYSVWTLPDERWLEEQDYLLERGMYSPLFGYPDGVEGEY